MSDVTNFVVNGQTINVKDQTARNSISTLNSAISLLNTRTGTPNRRIILIADSYGMRVHPSYTDLIISYLGLTLNSSAFNISESGAGFARPGNTFLGHLQSNYNNITNHDTITDIIVGGGFNDANALRAGTATESGIVTAISDFASYCKANYPNAKLWLHFDAYANSILTSDIGAVSQINFYLYRAEALYASAGRYGFAYMPNVKYTLHDTTLLDTTYFHPNENGNIMLANNVLSYLLGGSCSTSKLRQLTYTANSDISLNEFVIYQAIEDGICRLMFGGIGSTINIDVTPPSGETTFTIATGNAFKLCDLDSYNLLFIGDKRSPATAVALARLADNSLVQLPVTIQLINGGLFFSHYISETSFKEIIIRPFEITYNTMLADIGSFGNP